MTMTDVKIQVPDGMVSYVIANDEQSELMRNVMLLYPYIRNLTISHGKAAEILGIRKYELINLYGKLGLPYLDQDMDEIDEEVQYWKKLKGETVDDNGASVRKLNMISNMRYDVQELKLNGKYVGK